MELGDRSTWVQTRSTWVDFRVYGLYETSLGVTMGVGSPESPITGVRRAELSPIALFALTVMM